MTDYPLPTNFDDSDQESTAQKHLESANKLRDVKNYKDAIKEYKEAIFVKPNFADAHLNLAIALDYTSQTDQAMDEYKRAFLFDPKVAERCGVKLELVQISDNKNFLSLAILGLFYSIKGEIVNFEKVIRELNKSAILDYQSWCAKGACFAYLELYNKAIECFDEALHINPYFAGAWANKGRAFERLGIYHDAIRCFEEAIKLKPDKIELAEALSDKCALLNRLGKFDDAIRCCDKAIRNYRKLTRAWSNKAAILINIRKYSDAIVCLDKAIKLNPEFDLAWLNRGLAFQHLEQFDEATKCFETAIKINPLNENAWINKGTICFFEKKYDEAPKSFNCALKIKPSNPISWSQKGVVLDYLKKYDEAIYCFDKSLELDPKSIGALINKSASLLDQEKFRETIEISEKILQIDDANPSAYLNGGAAYGYIGELNKAIIFFEKTIELDPYDAGGYINLGIAYFSVHRYDDAIKPLHKAKEIFDRYSHEEGSLEASKYETWCVNASKLFVILKPLDDDFMDCLDSPDLMTLKESCSKISNSIERIFNDFIKEELPEELEELLINKKNVYKAISDALNYNEINLDNLNKARKVFEKWDLNDLIIAVNSIDTFIRKLKDYEDIDKIPKSEESNILFILKNVHILGGRLTAEFRDRFIVDFRKKSSNLQEMGEACEVQFLRVLDNFDNYIKICFVQLDYCLTQTFPYRLLDESKVKNKIMSIIELSRKNNVNIICFPELSFSQKILDEIKKYKDIIIIGGSYYENNFNICPVIVQGINYPVYKIHPSPYLESPITKGGFNKGKNIIIFKTKDEKFSFVVLICWDFLKESWRIFHQIDEKDKVNIIFNPLLNKEVHRFQRRADDDCTDYEVDFIHVNIEKYGGSCVIGREHNDIIERFKRDGFRKNDEMKFKICEIPDNHEMAIIVKLNVFDKIIKPASIYSQQRFVLCGRFIYKDDYWSDCDSVIAT